MPAFLGVAILLVSVTPVGLGQPTGDGAGVLLVVGRPLEFVPEAGDGLEVDGTGVPGTVVVDRARSGEGLDVSVRAPLDAYVKALDPGRSAREAAALRAQAIVWRTQILASARSGTDETTALGVGDCSVDDCRALGPAPSQADWDRAVDATRAEVLVEEGDVMPAPSHDLAGGSTVQGTWAEFGDDVRMLAIETPNEPDENSTWTRTVEADDLETALRSAGIDLGEGAIEGVRGGGAGSRTVTVVTPERATTLDAAEFTRAVNAGVAGDGAPILASPRWIPTWVPADVSRGGSVARVSFAGKGAGHGFGLSRSEANGLAGERGWTPDEILDRFYPGRDVAGGDDVEPPVPEDVEIRVLSGVDSVAIRSADPFEIRAAGQTVVPAALTDWRVSVGNGSGKGAGGGSSLVLEGPPGTTAPLAVTGFTAPLRVTEEGSAEVRFVLSRPAAVSVVVDGPRGGRTLRLQDGDPLAAGTHTVRVDLGAEGMYRVSVRAADGVDTVTSKILSVDVDLIPTGPTSRQVAAAGAFCALLLGLTALMRRRRRRARGNFSQISSAQL
ncbi:MAG: hypothetical protein IT198_11090 [Acidimicrobiia bacterium]|nr:hypothetical protein [Acidimicrobiia bacterium]